MSSRLDKLLMEMSQRPLNISGRASEVATRQALRVAEHVMSLPQLAAAPLTDEARAKRRTELESNLREQLAHWSKEGSLELPDFPELDLAEIRQQVQGRLRQIANDVNSSRGAPTLDSDDSTTGAEVKMTLPAPPPLPVRTPRPVLTPTHLPSRDDFVRVARESQVSRRKPVGPTRAEVVKAFKVPTDAPDFGVTLEQSSRKTASMVRKAKKPANRRKKAVRRKISLGELVEQRRGEDD